ncbi:MAG: polysaccharide deacetylase family protein [Cyclobacteriaceae bacterium]|nr:polysaccharide deacetylase family protein [Cyclobacteriaceae bacterium]
MNGIFTISLDFELHWGGFEKWQLAQSSQSPVGGRQAPVTGRRQRTSLNEYFLSTRQAIPRMLELFEKHGGHVTWASVGLLLNDSKEELLRNAPSNTPSYKNQKLSAYHFVDTHGIGQNEQGDPFHFAPSLVRQILKTPHQELGTHSYAHFYCNEPGQTVEQFREDLKAAKKVSEKYGVKVRSMVFPRNQFNDAYLEVCIQEGITSVRSNPLDWFWNIQSTQNEPAWKRLNRGLDAYFPIGKKNTYKLSDIPVRSDIPVCLPASRLLRPYRPTEWLLNDFKINRIKSEMIRAARNSEVYHLWWHPHNFGHYPEQSLLGLEKILSYYNRCRDQYGMISLNMGETCDLIHQLHGKNQAA